MKAAKSGQSPVTPTLTGNSQARPFTRNSAFLNTSRYVMPSARPPQTPGACHHGSRVQRLGQRPFSSRQPPPRPGTPGPLETWGGGGGGGGGDGVSATWELGFFPWARPSGFSHIPFIVVGSAIPARVSPETPR